MNKWVAITAGAVAVAWGPFLYAELTNEPAEKKGRDLPKMTASQLEEPAESPPAAQEPEPESSAATEEAEAQAELEALAAALGQAEGANEDEPGEADDQADDQAGPKAEGEATVDEASDTAEAEADSEEANEEAEKPPAPPPTTTGPLPVLKGAFETEPRDALWAADTEQRLAALFSGEEMPEELFQRVSCRKTVCQLELQWGQLQAEGYAGAYNTIREQFGNQVGVEPIGESDENGSLPIHLYVLRKGYSLADLQD